MTAAAAHGKSSQEDHGYNGMGGYKEAKKQRKASSYLAKISSHLKLPTTIELR